MSEVSQQRLLFSFGEAEASLAQVHRVADAKRTAFQARLKNLLKLGLLPDVQAGRGRAAAYGPWHLFQLGFALECAQLGMTPARTIGLMQNNLWFLCQVALMVGRHGGGRDGHLLPMMVTFDPSALNDMVPDDFGDAAELSFNYAGVGILTEGLQEALANGMLRTSIINVSEMVRRITSRAAPEHVEQFYLELTGEAKRVQEEEIPDGDT
jgi:hypothetical protein